MKVLKSQVVDYNRWSQTISIDDIHVLQLTDAATIA